MKCVLIPSHIHCDQLSVITTLTYEAFNMRCAPNTVHEKFHRPTWWYSAKCLVSISSFLAYFSYQSVNSCPYRYLYVPPPPPVLRLIKVFQRFPWRTAQLCCWYRPITRTHTIYSHIYDHRDREIFLYIDLHNWKKLHMFGEHNMK